VLAVAGPAIGSTTVATAPITTIVGPHVERLRAQHEAHRHYYQK
jgi:hypothetical protein